METQTRLSSVGEGSHLPLGEAHNMSRNGVIVEFVGLPGVGKSTLALRTAEILRQRGMPVSLPSRLAFREEWHYTGKIRRWAYYARFALSNLRYSLLSAHAILSSRQASRDDFIWVLLTWFKRSARIQRQRHLGGVHLNDSGIFQGLWSIGFSGKNADLVGLGDHVMAWLPTPNLVVVVEASLSTIERRLANRPGAGSRLERWLPGDPVLWARAAALLGQVKEAARSISRKREDMRILMIANDRDDAFETNAMRIAEAAWEIVHFQGEL